MKESQISGGSFDRGDTFEIHHTKRPFFEEHPERQKEWTKYPTNSARRATEAFNEGKWRGNYKPVYAHKIFESLTPASLKPSRRFVLGQFWRDLGCRVFGHRFGESATDPKFEYICRRCRGWVWGKR